MTAVEWLIDQIIDDQFVSIKSQAEWQDLFKKAKEKEKKQIISAHESASLDAGFENSASDWAEDYYKYKYKK